MLLDTLVSFLSFDKTVADTETAVPSFLPVEVLQVFCCHMSSETYISLFLQKQL